MDSKEKGPALWLAIALVASWVFFGVAWMSRGEVELLVPSSRAGDEPPETLASVPTQVAAAAEAIEAHSPRSSEPQEEESRERVDAPAADEVGSLDDLVDAFHQLDREAGLAQRLPLLRKILALETDVALEAVLDLMRDGGVAYSQKPQLFVMALRQFEDPRIFVAAREALEANLERGLRSWVETNGYIDLIAKNGGDEVSSYLFEMLREDRHGGQVRHKAAKVLARIEDTSRLAEYLELARTDFSMTHTILEGLATWRDPVVRQAVLAFAQDASVPENTRDYVYSTYGSSCDTPELFRELLAQLRSTPQTELPLAISALFSACNAVDEEYQASAVRLSLPFLRECLLSGFAPLAARCLIGINNTAEDMPLDIVETLQVYASALSNDERQDVLDTISRIEAYNGL